MPIAAVLPFLGAAIGVGGSIASAVIGARAAKKAADTQAEAARIASDTTLKMYETSRGDLAPYRDTGGAALKELSGLYGLGTDKTDDGMSPAALEAFKRSPDYQVRMKAGMEGVNAADAGNRSLLSGAHMTRLLEKSSEIADLSFNNYIGRLWAMAGMGASAAGRSGSDAMTTGSNLANLTLNQGAAAASGTVGGANAITNGIDNATSNLAYLAMRKGSYGDGGGTISGARGMYF